MSTTASLFTPARLGALELPNRIVMAPMTRNRATPDAVPSELAPEYYRQRADAGLIVTEGAQVSQQGQGYPLTPGIYNDAQVAAWRKVTAAVHAAGGRIVLQLWHVGRVSHESLQPGGALPVAPSPVRLDGNAETPDGPQPHPTPRPLEIDEIPSVVAQFERGARLAKEAGFDGVEIHGANGYIIDQFLQDNTNRRTDAYGGSVANRARFLLEVTDAVVDVWTGERVGVRLSPNGTFNAMADSDRGATFGYAVRALNGYGLAYLHVVEGGRGAERTPDERAVVDRLRALRQGAYIANQSYDRERAAAAIASGRADAVAFGVPYLANPDLVERLRAGAPLNEPDRATFYAGDAKGYTDYPTLAPVQAA